MAPSAAGSRYVAALQHILKDFGFTVKLVVDPTSRELKKALQEMAFSLGSERDRGLLFYFAGHGETLHHRLACRQHERSADPP